MAQTKKELLIKFGIYPGEDIDSMCNRGRVEKAMDIYAEEMLRDELVAFSKWFNKCEQPMILPTIENYLKNK